MLTSMTGFGRAISESKIGKLTAEIQSVNRKYLEVFVSLPKEFSRFEPEIRKWVGEFISRGQVSVRIFLNPNQEMLIGSIPDIKILKDLKKKWEKIAKELKMDSSGIDLPFLMQYLPVQSRQDMVDEGQLSVLKECVIKALENLVKMKRSEGKTLAKDLSSRLSILEKLITSVQKHAPDATKKMRQRLMEKMEELLKPAADLEERLLREVAVFAEKVDITEEIIRFRSHISQFKEVLKEKSSGRKMDFLIQEMGREINTIGSKSLESSISHLVVEMKSELEKIREQIQNLE
jgi:uncharacterized protein (TIGR00255 family)